MSEPVRVLCVSCREQFARCGDLCGHCWCDEYDEDYYRLKHEDDEPEEEQ